MFNFKKGDKEINISTLVVVAGAVIVTDVIKNVCQMVVDKADIVYKNKN